MIRSSKVLRLSLVFLWGGWLAAPPAQIQSPAQTPKKLKVYISVDMEGVAGVVTADQLGPAGFEYERFRHFMTNETLAAIHAAKESGAIEVVVNQSDEAAARGRREGVRLAREARIARHLRELAGTSNLGAWLDGGRSLDDVLGLLTLAAAAYPED